MTSALLFSLVFWPALGSHAAATPSPADPRDSASIIFQEPASSSSPRAQPSDGAAQAPDGAKETDETDDTDRSNEGEGRPIVEDEILVTSTLPELVTGSSIPRRELQGSPDDDLIEYLRQVPGSSAFRKGAINLGPVVRGLDETRVATLVDGSRTFAAGPARMDSGLSHVGRHDVESLRMVKGPYALTWGSGALAAIDLITRRPPFDDGWSARVGASWDENPQASDSFANVQGSGERWRLYLGAGHREGGDYEAGDGSLVPADYTSSETRWRFGYRPSTFWTVELSGGYQQQEDIDYPGRLLDATYFYARSHALEVEGSGSERVQRFYGQVYSNRKDHLMNNDEKPTARDMAGRKPPFALRVALPAESNTSGGRLRLDLAGSDAFSWSVGGDFSRSDQSANRTVSRRSNDFVLFRDIVWPDARADDLGLWAQGVWQHDRTRFGATVRADDISAKAGETSAFFRDNAPGAADGRSLETTDTYGSAAISLTRELSRGWSIQAGIGRAVRPPTTLERYSDRFPATRFQLAAEFVGNPLLEPETSTQVDLGARYSTRRTTLAIEGFYREIDDYITFVADPTLPKRLPLSPPTVFRYLNGEATYSGAEVSIDQRWSDRFSWHGDLAWLEGTDGFLDEPALGIAPLTLNLAGRFAAIPDFLWIGGTVRITERQDRVASRRFERPTDGATVVSLGADLRLGDAWLELDVENLTDEAYAEHLNAPNPFTGQRILEIGRSVRLGFRLDI